METIEVKVGDVWKDNDPRSAGRTLRIDAIEGDRAVCTVLTNSDDTQATLDNPPDRTWGLPTDRRGTMVETAEQTTT